MNRIKILLAIAFASRAIAEAVEKVLADKKVTVGEVIEVLDKSAEAFNVKNKVLINLEKEEAK